MNLATVIGAIQKLAGLPRNEALKGLQPPEQLRAVLARERARSNRSGDPLSLVTFAPRCPEAERSTPALVVKILRSRLRTTDDLGWLDDRHIGVVLPSTPAAGAWKVADDVCLGFCGDVPPPICTVYSHPFDDAPPGNGPAVIPRGAKADLSGRRSLGLELLLLQAQPVWKRTLDVTVAVIGLIMLLPLFGAIVAALKLSSPGSVLFRQWRSGRGGQPFVMYKFRTMVVDAEARKAELLPFNEQDGPAFKVRHDPRVTRLGRFLRRTSLDELPQLWNVLQGHMSLVGPRPLPCEETEACEGWQRQRLDVVPGLTCIWQVKGRSRVSFAEWVRMDLQYIRSRSLWQDLKLLLLTAPALVLRKGAY